MNDGLNRLPKQLSSGSGYLVSFLPEIDSFNFFRDQNGSVTARCCWCLIGFEVTAENTVAGQVDVWSLSTGCVKSADRRCSRGAGYCRIVRFGGRRNG
jgi:hypothetical protein